MFFVFILLLLLLLVCVFVIWEVVGLGPHSSIVGGGNAP